MRDQAALCGVMTNSDTGDDGARGDDQQ